MSIFNINGKFYSMMLKISDIVILNCLFIIMSIPLITIGANLTALYYVGFKIVQDEEYNVFKSYWKSFRENFKQATLLSIIMLVIGFSLSFYIKYFGVLNNTLSLMGILFLILVCIYLVNLIYIFPLLSRFEFTIKGLLSSLPLIATRYLFCTITVLLITIFPVVIFSLWLSEYLSLYLIVLAVGGISGTVALNASFLSKAFENLIKEKNK